MKLFVAFNCAGLDEELFTTLTTLLRGYHWQPEPGYYGAFHKMESDGMLIGEAEKMICQEISTATFETECKNLQFLYLVEIEPVRFGITKAD
jgi:hypothetical protein